MRFQFPALLYRSTLIRREIDAEHRRPKPDRLRLMRLNALRLRLMNRIVSAARQTLARRSPLTVH
jgi:hypothetical protein